MVAQALFMVNQPSHAAAATASAHPCTGFLNHQKALQYPLLTSAQHLSEDNPASVSAASTTSTQLIGICQSYNGEHGYMPQQLSSQELPEDKDENQDPSDENADILDISCSGEQQSFANLAFQNDSDDTSDGELIIVDEGDNLKATGDKSAFDVETPTAAADNEQDALLGIRRRNGTRSEAQQKMEDGKHWLLNNLMFINTVSSVISLNSVDEAYKAYCKETGKEPLTTPVLARLIRCLFPKALKCRLGSRGSQKIHYRSLQLKTILTALSKPSGHMPETLKNLSGINGTASASKSVNADCVDIADEKISNMPEQMEAQAKDSSEQKKNLSDPGDSTESVARQQPKVNMSAIDDKQVDSKSVVDDKEIDRKPHVDDKEVDNQSAAEADRLDQVISESSTQRNLAVQISADDKEGCETAAQRLSQVLKWISNQGRKDFLLREFAHSASCQATSCTPVCLMFRRVRRHVVAARHSCFVLRLYSGLLRMHVSSCNNSECGLPACPALRATKAIKRSLGQQESSSKRTAVQISSGIRHPSTLALTPRSPETSLPGSPVNSPPVSPEPITFRDSLWPTQPGQVQYVIVPVMPVMMPFSDNRGA